MPLWEENVRKKGKKISMEKHNLCFILFKETRPIGAWPYQICFCVLLLSINITVLSAMLGLISVAVAHIVRSLSQLRDCHFVNNYTPEQK